MASTLNSAASPLRRSSLLPAGLALALTAMALPLPVLADGPEPRSAALQQQEAQALARLSTPELRSYFEARRQLERRGADQRLSELRQLEDCLVRTRLRAGADTCLTQFRQRRDQQRQWGLSDLSALRQRYGLPPLPGVASIPSRPSWLVPQPRQLQTQPGVQSRGDASPAYGWY